MDYRYFPDPDLLPLAISREWIERVRATLPELPSAKRERFVREFSLSEYEASILTSSPATASYFEAVAHKTFDRAKVLIGIKGQEPVLSGVARLAAIWIMGDISAALNESEMSIEDSPVTPGQLAGLLARELDGTINRRTAKGVFAALWAKEGESADALIESRGLRQISDTGEIERLIDKVLAANAQSVAEFKAGKDKAFNALVGQAMKATKGKANPAQVNEILRRKLAQN